MFLAVILANHEGKFIIFSKLNQNDDFHIFVHKIAGYVIFLIKTVQDGFSFLGALDYMSSN